MRCAALQIEPHFADPEVGFVQVERLLAEVGPLDLALLPEACFTGYVSSTGDFNLSPMAEPLDGPTATRLACLAHKHQVTLAGPLIERDGARFFNSFLIFGPDGTLLARYRKRHPWFPERWATPGDLPYPRLDLRGRSLLLAICYDVHFLSEEISEHLDRADILLFPAAWVDGQTPEDTRSTLLPGLARHHRIAIVHANWARTHPYLPGQGGSRILGPDGALLAPRLGLEVGFTVAML
ncbi:MAG: carbon-nitrogen hydrolase family protein [Myxococcales bacterium]|nr:carbon-nitrogen hydrolase family protein [Myxococcales bacterium]